MDIVTYLHSTITEHPKTHLTATYVLPNNPHINVKGASSVIYLPLSPHSSERSTHPRSYSLVNALQPNQELEKEVKMEVEDETSRNRKWATFQQ